MAKNVTVNILGDNKDLLRKLGQSDSKLGAFATNVGKVAIAAGAAIGVAAAAGAVKSIAAFAEFEGSMNEVFTLLPGITDDAMSEMSGSVKNFSTEFGVLPDEVVPALYQALSAGVPKDNVFEFLETAQMAAKGGVTDLTVAVDGISSVVNAYGSDVVNATQASDLMFTAVRLGKTTFEELSSSLSNVTPIASGLGVEFEDVAAGLASLTAKGVPTAQATTQLRSLFVELSKAGGNTAEVFERTAGQSFQEFIAAGGNTAEALDIMQVAADESGVQIQDLFGSVEAGSAALALSSDDSFANNIGEMGNAAGATEAAFDQMMTGLGPIFDRFKANLQVFMITVGEKLAPLVERAMERAEDAFAVVSQFVRDNWPQVREVIADVMDYVKDTVVPIAETAFDAVVGAARAVVDFFIDNWDTIRDSIEGAFQWMLDNKAVVAGAFIGVGIGIATFLVPPLVASAVASVAAAAPMYLLIAALAALGGGLVYAYQNFEGFRNVVDAVAAFLRDTVWPIIQDVAAGIVDVFQAVVTWVQTNWPTIQAVFLTVWDTVVEVVTVAINIVRTVIETVTDVITAIWETHGDRILGYIETVWETIKTVIDSAINIVRGYIETVTSLISGDWDGVWNGIKTILSGVWDGIKALVQLAIDAVALTITLAIDAIQLAWETVWNAVSSFASEIWDTISGFVETGIDAVVGFVTGLPGRISDAVSGAFDSLYDGFKGVINMIIDAWNNLSLPGFSIGGQSVSAFGVTVGLPELNVPSLDPFPHIPRLHTGGFVGNPSGPRRDVPIMAQQGEFVLSSNDVTKLMSGGGGGRAPVHIHLMDGVTVRGMFDERDAELLAGLEAGMR